MSIKVEQRKDKVLQLRVDDATLRRLDALVVKSGARGRGAYVRAVVEHMAREEGVDRPRWSDVEIHTCSDTVLVRHAKRLCVDLAKFPDPDSLRREVVLVNAIDREQADAAALPVITGNVR